MFTYNVIRHFQGEFATSFTTLIATTDQDLAMEIFKRQVHLDQEYLRSYGEISEYETIFSEYPGDCWWSAHLPSGDGYNEMSSCIIIEKVKIE